MYTFLFFLASLGEVLLIRNEKALAAVSDNKITIP